MSYDYSIETFFITINLMRISNYLENPTITRPSRRTS